MTAKLWNALVLLDAFQEPFQVLCYLGKRV